MLRNNRGISIFLIISVLGLIALAFILILPQVMNIQSKENTEQCLKNMREIENAINRFMNDRQESFIGDAADLHRTGYLKRAVYVCPEGTPESRYYMEGDFNTGKITITCPHVDEYPDHILHKVID